MPPNLKYRWLLPAILAGVAALGLAGRTSSRLFEVLGVVGAAVLGRVLCYLHAARADRNSRASAADASDGMPEEESVDAPLDAGDLNSLVEGMLSRNRYALLLRKQLVANLTQEQYQRAREQLERQMALVPAGNVSLAPSDKKTDNEDEEESAAVAMTRHVEPLFLDRYPVTNRMYCEFLKGGGYEQMSIWDPQIWTAVFDFVDSTEMPGPRFWKNGRYPRGEEDLPVVGICWYEAAAYARWAGKRLPTEAEWVKAGSWPVPLSDRRQWQRKFPWGDTMDRERCNLWGSGPGKVVAVGEFSSGVSVGGVYQLIGNVWEWTTGNFGGPDCAHRDLTLPTPMKSIRGGAFDTYFENQATCHFQSGENPLARKHNIGFRCALSLCDVASPLARSQTGESPAEFEEMGEAETDSAEGVHA